MKDRKPDFNRLKKVLLRTGEPDILPFYEIFADGEIIEAVTGKPYSIESSVEFQYKMGYDFVGTGVSFDYPHKDTTLHYAKDVGTALPREARYFVNDNHGTIENREDFNGYSWPVIDENVMVDIDKCAGILPDGMKMIIGAGPGGILENVVWLMGYIPFSYALADDEQLIWDMFEKIGTNAEQSMKIAMEKADLSKVGAVIMGDDMGYDKSTMLSPEVMRKFVFPWQKKIADIAHDHDLPFILHSCGNLTGVMDDLIDYVGIDAKHSYEDKIMPVAEAKRLYGNRIAILGGVDMHFLTTATLAEVEPYVSKIIEECAPGGGYALGTGNSVANYIPLDNYFEMLRVGNARGKYL